MTFAKKTDFAAVHPKRIEVDASELGKDYKVLVQEPDGLTGEALSAADYPMDDSGNARFNRKGRWTRWAIACTVDESGAQLWSDADTDAVNRLPMKLVKRIAEAAILLSRGAPDDVVNEAKNS